MTQSRAPYMEWAKKRPVPSIDLAGSNLLACSLSEIPGAREAVDTAGVRASEEELARIARVAERTGTPVLFDEVYLETVLEDRPAPAATRSPLFLTTSSLTKAYGLASLRCGWILSSAQITRRILGTR